MANPMDSKVQALAGMFGSMELDVIRVVLEANQGSVDRTAEQLLQMGGGSLPDTPPSGNKPTQTTLSYQQHSQQQPFGGAYDFNYITGSSASSSSVILAPADMISVGGTIEKKQADNRNILFINTGELPLDFLRPFSWFQSGHINPQLAQDALIAQQLQDQLFREGIAEARANVREMPHISRRNSQTLPSQAISGGEDEDDSQAVAKLKELSDTARHKINSLVSRFKKPSAAKESLVASDHLAPTELTQFNSDESSGKQDT